MTRRRRRHSAEKAVEPVVVPEKKTIPPPAGEDQCSKETRIISRYKDAIKNPLTAIRSHCVECMGAAIQSVAECSAPSCSLYKFRMGKNPYHKRSGVAPDMTKKEGK